MTVTDTQAAAPAAGGLRSVIREVECLLLEGAFPFVVVRTDDGLVGYGECFRRSPHVTKTTVDQVLRPLLLGKNALDIAPLWDEMFREGRLIGPLGSLLPAVAGVDIALWDILGKALGAPIYQLLGGKRRDRVPFYASSLRRDLTPEAEADRAEAFLEQGWTGYKMHGAVPGRIDDPADHTVATVQALRARLGDRVQLMVDVNASYSRHRAIQVGRALQELGVFMYEEPVRTDDLEGNAMVADALDMAVASGEWCFTRWEFLQLAQKGRVDILQPDIVKVGGFTEMRRIEAVASAANVPITVHNTQPLLSTVAHLHFCAASAITPYAQEYSIEPVSIRDTYPLLQTPLAFERGGYLRVPDGPGLGVEMDLPLMRRLAGGAS